MASEHEPYLAVLKASYDYDPQPDAVDELAVKENQLLFLLERSDDDWWKVKIKTDSQDGDGLSGLVPSAYVEPAPHISAVKALYDYEAQQAGELSVHENDTLYVYDKEEDWLLVQSQTDDKIGYVPGNYVEEGSDEEGASEASPAASPPVPNISAIVIPDSPPKPAYTDPAELVNRSKAKAQSGTVETWSVSEVDKKGKKKKGTLGIGNGAMFFASESDKTPVQKWQTTDIQSTRLEKTKHVHIEVGGPTPISLHFHSGSKDVADAIVAKLEEARASAAPEEAAPSVDTPAALATTEAVIERPRSAAQKSVHFDVSEPKIIPSREDAEPEEDEPAAEREEEDDDDEGGERATVLYDFTADGDDEMSVHEGETLYVLERDTDEWWKCRNEQGDEGVVPANYLELVPGTEGRPPPAARSTRDREAEEKAAQEERERERKEQERRDREDAERKEKERKKAEAEQRAKASAMAAEADRRRREQERDKQRDKEKERERERAAAAAAEERERERNERRDSSSEGSVRSSRGRGAGDSSGSRNSTEKRPPPTDNIRVWHDRTGQFRVEAAYLGFANGKIRLHKTNGVIIEVPQEKMSAEDMRYVEKVISKQQHKSPQARSPQERQKKPTVDWFEFFLDAGCDVDDCTRYAQAFERDKIDEAILPDITESTMRSLGLREGDIIRVKKAIDQRQPKKPQNDSRADQLRRDEELARQLQAEENGGTPRGQPPDLFTAGPNGALKTSVRRGRPQPSKSLPPSTVDIKSISSASDQIQRTGTPTTTTSPVSMSATESAANRPPSRPTSAAPVTNGFDDDAWTNRPSSTRPIPPSSPARAPSAPIPPAPTPPAVAPAAPAPPPAPPAPPAPAPPVATSPTGTGLAHKTESDIFEQLARLSALKPVMPPVNRPVSAASALQPSRATPSAISPPPLGFQSGMGLGASSLPMGQALQAQQTGLYQPAAQPVNPNAPRGPLAPIPANQGLLQPLVPTSSGFNNFVPTRPQSAPFQPTASSSFLNPQPTGFQPQMQQPTGFQPQPTGFQPQMQQPLMAQPTGFQAPQPTGFQAPQPTGFQAPMNQQFLSQPTGFQPPVSQPMVSQPTGFQSQGPLLSQPTGFGGGLPPFQNSGTFSPVQPNPTGFNPGFGQFNGGPSPPPAAPAVNTNPANVFASMKSGTFGSDNNSVPQPADKYDSLRPNPTGLTMQATGWNGGYQSGFNGGYGYQR